MKFILACDESGAKGYADQDEQFPGQVGVFAGLLVPKEVLAQTEAVLEAAIAPHRGGNGKLHVTDLEKAAQADLRQRLFEGIQALHLPCFWYAIHVAGYRDHHEPHRVCRRLQLLRGWSLYEQDDEQVCA